MSRLCRGLNDMRMFRALHQAMHGRLVHSEAVRAAHERFLTWIRELVYEMADEAGDPALDRELVADTACTLFEGFNVEPGPPRPGTELMRSYLESALRGPARAGTSASVRRAAAAATTTAATTTAAGRTS